jgi:putative transport protein
VHVERGDQDRPEVDDKALLDIPIETLDVVVTNRSWSGKRWRTWHDSSRAWVFLRTHTRAGYEIPIAPDTESIEAMCCA